MKKESDKKLDLISLNLSIDTDEFSLSIDIEESLIAELAFQTLGVDFNLLKEKMKEYAKDLNNFLAESLVEDEA